MAIGAINPFGGVGGFGTLGGYGGGISGGNIFAGMLGGGSTPVPALDPEDPLVRLYFALQTILDNFDTFDAAYDPKKNDPDGKFGTEDLKTLHESRIATEEESDIAEDRSAFLDKKILAAAGYLLNREGEFFARAGEDKFLDKDELTKWIEEIKEQIYDNKYYDRVLQSFASKRYGSMGTTSQDKKFLTAIDLIYSNFDIIDALIDNKADGKATEKSLEKIADNENISVEIRAAAKFLLDNEGYRKILSAKLSDDGKTTTDNDGKVTLVLNKEKLKEIRDEKLKEVRSSSGSGLLGGLLGGFSSVFDFSGNWFVRYLSEEEEEEKEDEEEGKVDSNA